MSPEPTTWLNKRERGAIAAIRSVFWLATVFGRTPARLLLYVIAFWYALFDRRAARASRQWLERVHGRPATFRDVYGHILRFGQVALDRIFLLTGKTKGFEVNSNGHHHLVRLRDEGRGAILLGAHLGSFEAGRAQSEKDQLPINIVGFFENAKMINALFARLNPERAARVIHIGEGGTSFILKVQEAIERGELVAMLGDRVGLNANHATADFFGAPARFATGPFLVAHALKCPVYLVFGLHHPPNRYELYCEPFEDPVQLPRATRAAALDDLVRRYASRLEHYARLAPDNWFNFYDFWHSGPAEASQRETAR